MGGNVGTFKRRVSFLATAVNTGCDENQTSEKRGPDGLFTTAKACPLALATLVDPRRDEKQTAKLRRAPAGAPGPPRRSSKIFLAKFSIIPSSSMKLTVN